MIEVFKNEDIVSKLSFDTDLNSTTKVNLQIFNKSTFIITNALVQVAVPKHLSLKMDLPSGTEVRPNDFVIQTFVISTSMPQVSLQKYFLEEKSN